MYRIIIEILHQQEDSKISIEAYKEYIKFYCQDKEIATSVEQVLNTCWLLLQQNGNICSKRVLQNKKIREEISEKRSIAGKISAEKRAKDSQTSTSVEQGKEKKGKERKEKEENDVFSEFLKPEDQQTKITQAQKRAEVNSLWSYRISIRNKITGRNDLMDGSVFRDLQNFIRDLKTEDFTKRVEIFKTCRDKINEHKLWKFLTDFWKSNIQDFSITDFIKKINLFGWSVDDVFNNIVSKEYITKVIRIITPKKLEEIQAIKSIEELDPKKIEKLKAYKRKILEKMMMNKK